MSTALTEGDVLFADVLAHPADDTPRLVLADWLEEHDEAARAEFIRLQCRLAAQRPKECLPGCDGDGCNEVWCNGAQCAYDRAERLLDNGDLVGGGLFPPPWAAAFEAGEWTWSGVGTGPRVAFCRDPAGGVVAFTLRRGFVAEVCLTGADWLAHAEALLACCPLEWVVLTSLPEITWQGSTVGDEDGGWYARLSGREAGRWYSRRHDAAYVVPYLLRAAWPRLIFDLPGA